MPVSSRRVVRRSASAAERPGHQPGSAAKSISSRKGHGSGEVAAKAAHLPGPIDGPTVGSSALKLSEATAVLPGVGEDARVIAVAPVAAGTATIAVTPELYDQPECLSAPITVVEP